MRTRHRVLLLAAGAVLFPAAALAVTGIPTSVASILAALVIYAWLLGLVLLRRRLTRSIGPWTAYAALGMLAAVSLAPLALVSPLCSAGVGSPWCRREIGSWAVSGLLAAVVGLALAVARRSFKGLRTLPGHVRNLRRGAGTHETLVPSPTARRGRSSKARAAGRAERRSRRRNRRR